MAIITHPDGYLQITEGHPWQDISDEGILQRIFRGWNERRLVAGLPLYWYGKNPNASVLLGGDAQFTEFENPLTVPNPTYTLDDARIYPGAVLQNVEFWRKLQEVVIEKNNNSYITGITTSLYSFNAPIKYGAGGFVQYQNGNKNSTYSNIQVLTDNIFNAALSPNQWLTIGVEDQKIFPEYTEDFAYIPLLSYEELYNICGENYSRNNFVLGYIEPGDVISEKTINDLLKVYSRITSAFFVPSAINYTRQAISDASDYPSPIPQDPQQQCQIAFSSAVSRLTEIENENIAFSSTITAQKIGTFFDFRSFVQFENARVTARFQNISRITLVWYQVPFREIDGFDNYQVYAQNNLITNSVEQTITNNYSFNVSNFIGQFGDGAIWDMLDATCANLSNTLFVRKAAAGEFRVFYQYQFADLPQP